MLQHLACSSFFGALRASEFMQVGRTTGSSTLSRYTLWTASPHTRPLVLQTCQRETESALMTSILARTSTRPPVVQTLSIACSMRQHWSLCAAPSALHAGEAVVRVRSSLGQQRRLRFPEPRLYMPYIAAPAGSALAQITRAPRPSVGAAAHMAATASVGACVFRPR